MRDANPAYGQLVAALGAIVLAVSVFLPWYGVSISARGIEAAQQAGDQVVAQFGNARLQQEWSSQQAGLGVIAGREIASVSARDALHKINVVLLVLAGLAILLAL